MIRQMLKGDLPSIKVLMQSIPNFWHDAWTDETLDRALFAAGDLAMVYEAEGQIEACIFCYDFGFRAYLGEIIVSERNQGQGIGERLLAAVEETLKERRCELIIADVWRSAELFYRKLGWEEPEAQLLRKRLL